MTPEEMARAQAEQTVASLLGQQAAATENPASPEDAAAQAAAQQQAGTEQKTPEQIAAEEAAAQQAAATQQQTQPAEVSLEDVAAGKLKLSADLQERLALADKVLADPKAAKLLDIMQGDPANVREVLRITATDFDNMTPKEVLRHQFAEAHPDLVDDDRAFDEYLSREIAGYDPESEDLTSSVLSKKDLEKRISSWKEGKNQLKSNFDQLFKKEEKAPAQTGPTPEQIEAERSRRKQEVGSLTSVKIELADGLAIDLPVGDQERVVLEQAASDPGAFMAAKYMSDDSNGQKVFNAKKFAEDMAILQNAKTIALEAAKLGMDAQNGQNQEAFNQALGRGTMKKPGDAASSTEQPTASIRDQHAALVEKLVNGG